MRKPTGYYEFGPFQFDFEGTRLERNGQEIPLGPQARKFLLDIIDNRLTGKPYFDTSGIGYFGRKTGSPYLDGKEVARALGQGGNEGPYLEEHEFGDDGGWDEKLFGPKWTKWHFIAPITIVRFDNNAPAAHVAVPSEAMTDDAPKKKEYDCFVSYASEDRPLVEKIVSALESRGVTVWWDRGKIKLGDSLSRRIDEGLASSRFGLVIFSPFFAQKRWTDAELRGLHHRAMSSGRKIILPILCGFDHATFAKKYPILADIVSTTFSGDIDALIDEIVDAIRD
jgi:hypothetical protein